MAPIYAFYAGLAAGRLRRGAGARRRPCRASVWSRATGNGRRSSRFVLGRVTIPAVVATLNGLKLGPFSAMLTGQELRRAGLLAMARVADVLAPDAEHVLFGHTHRAGPLPGDDAGGVDDARRHPALEQRQLAPTSAAFVKGTDEQQPVLARHGRAGSRRGRPPRLENALPRLRRRRDRRARRRAQRVRGLVELARALPERPGERRPERGVVAVAVDVVARAAARDPDRAVASSRRARRCRRPAPRGGPRARAAPRRAHRLQRVEHVVDLRLDHEHDRGVAETGVRADEEEQVREARRRWCPGRPACVPSQARRACGRRGRACDPTIGMSVTWKPVPKMIVSTSRSLAVGGDDRVRPDLGDRVGDHLDVRLRERRVPVVRRAGCACSRCA